jgi:hypothetical protein
MLHHVDIFDSCDTDAALSKDFEQEKYRGQTSLIIDEIDD